MKVIKLYTELFTMKDDFCLFQKEFAQVNMRRVSFIRNITRIAKAADKNNRNCSRQHQSQCEKVVC